MTYYDSIVVLNFGYDLIKKYFSNRAGTGRYREVHETFGRSSLLGNGLEQRQRQIIL